MINFTTTWCLSGQEQAIFWEDDHDDVCFILYQYAYSANNIYTWTASLLKQQSTGKHVAPLEQIILILNKPVIALIPQYSDIKYQYYSLEFDPNQGSNP